MFYKVFVTKIIAQHIFWMRFVFVVVCLFCFMKVTPAVGQIFPYLSYFSPYFSPVSNPYLNSYSPNNLTNWVNPYLGLYNQFSVLNSFPTFNRIPSYPQANISGGLVPFTSFYTNPFAFPYIAAAPYFAAALIPADVSGTWSGLWTSTFLAGGVITGELSITLTQTDADVMGTAVFLLNKILKYGAYVVGTVEGNILTLNSTVTTSITGTMTYDVTITATVTDISMEGTYVVINLSTGLISEEGTFTATRL